MTAGNDSGSIDRRQQSQQRDEFRTAVRALLMAPLMSPAHENFAAVRRQSSALQEWFAHEAGWLLRVERDGARLYKRPANLADPTRGLPGYDRRRYVLLCLACAALERADPQITLRLLGEKLLVLAADSMLEARGFTFKLVAQHERHELVAVCRTLLDFGVLQRVAGDEQAFVQSGSEQGDALYDVQRRALAGLLAAVRGPSSWTAEDAPVVLEDRLRGLTDEHAADGEEGARTALRRQLSRRLLDDPVIYFSTLEPEARAYFANQRGVMASRLGEAAGLAAEQRAEGLALVDEIGLLTDVAIPAEGTDAHVTLLVAEHLATALGTRGTDGEDGIQTHDDEVAAFLCRVRDQYGRYWRKSAREPGAERELAAIAIDRLEKLQLIERHGDSSRPLPALARFALGEAEIRSAGMTRTTPGFIV